MKTKPNILVVCARNKRRSRTAEYIFKNDMRFHIASAGLSPKSERQVKEKNLLWANLVLVMEHEHKARITSTYRHIELPPIEVLSIDDNYDYLDPELVEILTHKINRVLQNRFLL